MEKKGQILAENIIFIVLNLIFISMLMLFVFSKAGGEAVLEEKYSKQIALIVDSAKPGMQIFLDMEDAIKKAEGNGINGEIVFIEGNLVTVKLRDKGQYSYSFFNDVDATVYIDRENKKYVITINEKQNE
ncbi:hypothetical protein J4407_01845 [Candidatus Pacearchaeota archaeon]|nr:hypothetical protein [Candidatus Pacearchaeota archaeon]